MKSSSRLKVLHVYRTYYPDTQGGLEEVIRQICRNTSASDVENRVFTLSRDPNPAELVFEGVEVFRCKSNLEIASCDISFFALATFRRLAEWADVLHLHFPWPFGDLLYLLMGLGKPAVVTYHSDVIRQQALRYVYEPVMRQLLSKVDRIIATSPSYAETSAILSQYSNKVEVVPIGIDEDDNEAELESDLVKSLEGVRFFFFVGVLRYYKGLEYLLEAAVGMPFKVVIAGKGPEEDSLQKKANELGLSNVVFAGRIGDEEKTRLFQMCEGVVFPSHMRSEAFGVTLVEGALHGKPLISAEVGTGTSYVNKHGVTGIVVRASDVGDLRGAMCALYEDPDTAKAMGRAARERYEQLFTGRLMGQRYATIYGQVLADRRAQEGLPGE